MGNIMASMDKAIAKIDSKPYSPGFADRFYAICESLGMKKFGRVRFFHTRV